MCASGEFQIFFFFASVETPISDNTKYTEFWVKSVWLHRFDKHYLGNMDKDVVDTSNLKSRHT